MVTDGAKKSRYRGDIHQLVVPKRVMCLVEDELRVARAKSPHRLVSRNGLLNELILEALQARGAKL